MGLFAGPVSRRNGRVIAVTCTIVTSGCRLRLGYH
jgi:hypothetical protein